MGIFSRVRNTAMTKTTVTEPTEWLKTYGTALNHFQSKQNTAKEQIGEIETGLSMADVDPSDKDEYQKVTQLFEKNLEKYNSEEYLGDYNTDIRRDAMQAKKVLGGFQDNALRRQKYIETASKEGLSEEEIRDNLELSDSLHGKLKYDPKTGFKGKFQGVPITPMPDVNKTVSELTAKLPLQKREEMTADGRTITREFRDTTSKEFQEQLKYSLQGDPQYVAWAKHQQLLSQHQASKFNDQDLAQIAQNPKLVEFAQKNGIGDTRQALAEYRYQSKLENLHNSAFNQAAFQNVENKSEKLNEFGQAALNDKYDILKEGRKEQADIRGEERKFEKDQAMAILKGEIKNAGKGGSGMNNRSEVLNTSGIAVGEDGKVKERGMFATAADAIGNLAAGTKEGRFDKYQLGDYSTNYIRSISPEYDKAIKLLKANPNNKEAAKIKDRLEAQHHNDVIKSAEQTATKTVPVVQNFEKEADRKAYMNQMYGNFGQGGFSDNLRVAEVTGSNLGEPMKWSDVRKSLDFDPADIKAMNKEVEGGQQGMITLQGQSKNALGKMGNGDFIVIHDPSDPMNPAKDRKFFVETDKDSNKTQAERTIALAREKRIIDPRKEGLNIDADEVRYNDKYGRELYEFYKGGKLSRKMIIDQTGNLKPVK